MTNTSSAWVVAQFIVDAASKNKRPQVKLDKDSGQVVIMANGVQHHVTPDMAQPIGKRLKQLRSVCAREAWQMVKAVRDDLRSLR